MRGFGGIDLGREPVPDETTVRRFRHLLETQDLGRQPFDEVLSESEVKQLARGRVDPMSVPEDDLQDSAIARSSAVQKPVHCRSICSGVDYSYFVTDPSIQRSGFVSCTSLPIVPI
jgi:hypothetical protein